MPLHSFKLLSAIVGSLETVVGTSEPITETVAQPTGIDGVKYLCALSKWTNLWNNEPGYYWIDLKLMLKDCRSRRISDKI